MTETATTLAGLMEREQVFPVNLSTAAVLQPGDKVLWVPETSDFGKDITEVASRVQVLVVQASKINGQPCLEFSGEKRTVELSLLADRDHVFYLRSLSRSSAPPAWLYRREEPVTAYASAGGSRTDGPDLHTALSRAGRRLPHDTVSHMRRALDYLPLSVERGSGCVVVHSTEEDFYDLLMTQLTICSFSIGEDERKRKQIEDERLGQVAEMLGQALSRKGLGVVTLTSPSLRFNKATLTKNAQGTHLILYYQ